MFRVCQCIAECNVKFVIAHIMQKHIDAAKVVCGQVYFLTEKSLSNTVWSKYLASLEQ